MVLMNRLDIGRSPENLVSTMIVRANLWRAVSVAEVDHLLGGLVPISRGIFMVHTAPELQAVLQSGLSSVSRLLDE